MRRITYICLTLIGLIWMVSPVFPEEKVITLGGAKGWEALSFSDGITRGPGQLGFESLILDNKVPAENSAVLDMYIPFDSGGITDQAGNYSVVSSRVLQIETPRARKGGGAALCNTAGEGLVLQGKPGTLFANPGKAESFTIEFWMYPSVIENGNMLFQWRSSNLERNTSIYQYIHAVLSGNHIEWRFSNIWRTQDGRYFDVSVSGRKNLMPDTWSFHEISYNANTGLLEYRLDGRTEDIRYITSTGTARGDIYPAIFGTSAAVELAPDFSGLLDEVRIYRSPAPPVSLERIHAINGKFRPEGGRFESMPIDSGGIMSSLNKITVVSGVPEGTDIAFFVRSGDNFYQWNDVSPEWIPVRPGTPITGISGRYFQVAGELYPDGNGDLSPYLTSLSLYYDQDSLPLPPARVSAVAGDASVTLSWISSIDSDTAGYLIYYGEHSGEYLAPGSPLDAGKNLSYTITGLKNGKQYYFSIAAYDDSGPGYPGPLSREVYARPLAVRKSEAGADSPYAP
ncbi:fibronectin type III domain-containing protein [Brucepastera parasyntrophica]|uniref:LamG-like jellyroll fold domain-containing protein n=1 Tax=Brucepastera parasyntrophica TaxID=2880008 RepID=UPI00210DF50C|nr:LamG-like jellyroll fold domain-containing protein [Brucepastera parasyntrophica]ULQ59380.1 fibronectin type III domain-containing protein [Brucepastera parasyntrophica]